MTGRLAGRPVCVLGGGIGGMAAALSLARRGASVTVHERAPVAAEVGAGLQIGPNGMRVLSALGLEAAVLARASEPEAAYLCDGPSGRRIATIPFGSAARARWGAPYVQLHRADLLELVTVAARDAGVVLRYGQTALRIDAGGVTFDGDAVATAPVVVGADGIRSVARAAIAPGHAPVFTGQIAWRGLVPAASLRGLGLPPAASVFLGPGRHLVAYPLRDSSQWNLVAVEERDEWTEEGWSSPASPDTVRAAFAGWCDPVTRLLAGLEDTFLWGLFSHAPLPCWQDGRTVLLGDACHPMLPFLAQGATMALEDAWVLAEELDRRPQADALACYEARRKPRTSRVQAQSARNAWVYHLRKPWRGPAYRGLSLVPSGVLVKGFDWLYGADVTAGGASRLP